MTVIELHTLIQQGLQNVGVFAYNDLLPQELDIQINSGINALIDQLADNLQAKKKLKYYESSQLTIDHFSVLKVKNVTLIPVAHSLGKVATLPNDYRNLLADRSKVSITCTRGGASVTDTETLPNRLMGTANIDQALTNPVEETIAQSPISEIISGTELLVYTKGFDVTEVYIDYLKPADTIDYIANPTAVLQFPQWICERIADYVTLRMAKIENTPNKAALLDGIRE